MLIFCNSNHDAFLFVSQQTHPAVDPSKPKQVVGALFPSKRSKPTKTQVHFYFGIRFISNIKFKRNTHINSLYVQ